MEEKLDEKSELEDILESGVIYANKALELAEKNGLDKLKIEGQKKLKKVNELVNMNELSSDDIDENDEALSPVIKPVIESGIPTAWLDEVLDRIGGDWKLLCRELGMSGYFLEANDHDYSVQRMFEAHPIMLRWKQQMGNDAAVQALAKALTAIGRNDVAEYLTRNSQQDGENIHIQNSEVQEDSNTDSGGNSLLYSAAYIRAREIGEAKNTRIPIIIVGKDRAGKTSLKKHLLGQPFDCQEPSTNGIEVDVVELNDGNAANPWEKKETTFFTSIGEAEEKFLENTAQLVMEREKIEENDASRTVEATVSQELVDKIDELLAENIDRENSTTIFVHDFAGQSIFYDTHFCFLKMQCPYVLVVDLNSPLDEEATPRFKMSNSERVLHDPFLETNLDYSLPWLTVLARLSDFYSEISPVNQPGFKLPPVVIALTNSDQCKAKEDIVNVKERFQHILTERAFENVFTEIFVFDNTVLDRNGEEIRRLRQKLYDLCKSILDQQLPMPVRWLDLEVALGNKIVDEQLMCISIENCRAVAESCNVTPLSHFFITRV